jgi:hypothetical protein
VTDTIHPALLVWNLLSIPASALLFLLTFPSSMSMWYAFWAIMSGTGFTVMLLAYVDGLEDYSLEAVTEDSSDWEDDEDEPQTLTKWWLIGIVGVFIVSFAFGLVLTNTITSTLWIPMNLLPLAVSTPQIYGFVTDLFANTFCVVSGEESLVTSFSPLHKVLSLEGVPFAFQPAVLIGRGFWSVVHVILGQLPMLFAVSVFVVGIVIDLASARTGSRLTGWLLHWAYNCILIIASFLTAGVLTITAN